MSGRVPQQSHKLRFASRPECPRCLNYGLHRVRYKSGESDDVAMCICAAGCWYRRAGEDFVRLRLGLTDDQQVGYLEQFDELKPVKGQVFKG